MIKKTNTLVEDFEYVSQFDEAVDRDVPDFDARWQRYLDGMDDVPLKPGGVPTRFVLKHLSSLEMDLVKDWGAKGGAQAAALVACAIGLKAAKEWEPGKLHVFKRELEEWVHDIEVVVQDELALLDGDVRTEIGSRVFMAATLRPN